MLPQVFRAGGRGREQGAGSRGQGAGSRGKKDLSPIYLSLQILVISRPPT